MTPAYATISEAENGQIVCKKAHLLGGDREMREWAAGGRDENQTRDRQMDPKPRGIPRVSAPTIVSRVSHWQDTAGTGRI
jgi:hypothetical protein